MDLCSLISNFTLLFSNLFSEYICKWHFCSFWCIKHFGLLWRNKWKWAKIILLDCSMLIFQERRSYRKISVLNAFINIPQNKGNVKLPPNCQWLIQLTMIAFRIFWKTFLRANEIKCARASLKMLDFRFPRKFWTSTNQWRILLWPTICG